jgi:hypothetical protein
LKPHFRSDGVGPSSPAVQEDLIRPSVRREAVDEVVRDHYAQLLGDG